MFVISPLYAWQLQIESFPSGFLSFSVPASIVSGYMISSASYYSCNQSFVEYAKWDRNTTMIDFATRLHTVQHIGSNTNPKRKDSVTHGAHTQVHRTWDQLVAYTVTIYHVTLFAFSLMPYRRVDTMQIRNWTSYHPLLVLVTFMVGVTIASTIQRQLPGDPWNLRSNQLILINPDDYTAVDSPALTSQVHSTLQSEWCKVSTYIQYIYKEC